jgi:hypothetical protein
LPSAIGTASLVSAQSGGPCITDYGSDLRHLCLDAGTGPAAAATSYVLETVWALIGRRPGRFLMPAAGSGTITAGIHLFGATL